METKVVKIHRILLGILLVLTLGLAFVVASSAEDTADYEHIHLMGSSSLTITPDGYRVNGVNGITEHTGGYVLSGKAGQDIFFKNETGSAVTYDVVLHELDARSERWYGCVSIDENVTLNITAYGKSMLVGDNHAGIKAKPGVTINITVAENSELYVGKGAEQAEYCIEGDPMINLITGVSSIDMAADSDWARYNDQIVFSNGMLVNHTVTPKRIADDPTAHALECSVCGPLATAEHRNVYESVNSTLHDIVCEVCGFYTASENHNLQDGECTLCDARVDFIHKDGDGNEQNFMSAEDAIAYASEHGGVLVLQRNLVLNELEIDCTGVDYTVDFNGHSIYNAYFFISSRYPTSTLTLTDSSEAGGGRLINGVTGNVVYGGTVVIDGVGGFYNAYAFGGSIIINSGEFDGISLSVSDGGSITVNGMTTTVLELWLNDFDSAKDRLKLVGGSWDIIRLAGIDLYPENKPVIADFLEDGRALFDGEGNLVNAFSSEIKEPTEIDSHTHDFENTIMSMSHFTHRETCACGLRRAGSAVERHTLGSDGICTGCGEAIVASLTTDEGDIYFTDVGGALELAYRMESELVTLLSDAYIAYAVISSGDITLDLNGHELWIDGDEIHVEYGATLTILDGSESGEGKLGYDGHVNYTAIGVEGKLILESGSILACIDLYGYGGTAELVVNGGNLSGSVIIYDNSSVTVNGGVFSSEDVFEHYFYEEETVNIILNGGVFEKGLHIEDYYTMTVNGYLPTDTECEIFFADENGDPVIFENAKEYTGYLSIVHSGAQIRHDGLGHSYYCESCDIVYGFEAHGKFTYAEKQDAHDVICGVCGYNTGAEAHVGGRATCTDLAVCELCEAEYGLTDPEAHVGGTANCTSPKICELCRTPYGEKDPKNHTSADTVFVENGAKHEKRRACCGIHLDSFEHGYDGACDTDCNVCNAARTVNHVYDVEGKCISCGAVGGESQAASATVPTGAVVGTAIGTAVVFGGGAFSLIWFVFRRRFTRISSGVGLNNGKGEVTADAEDLVGGDSDSSDSDEQ